MTHLMKRWPAALALAVFASVFLCARLPSFAETAAAPNQLTEEEKKAGWKLLFDGKSLDQWHNFREQGVRPGWQVKDGMLVCVDPKNAKDIVTKDKYDWFELSLDYNITKSGNSGIMFHISDEGRGAMWQTGPEIQLQDNVDGHDPEKSGWLYQLYKPEIDPKTGKPIDATKPVGEWNHVRVVIAAPPAKSTVYMNGVKYYDFVWKSDEFKDRVANSKFKSAARFATYDTGFIGLQGDHGSVSFRNIKIRPLPPKTSASAQP
jgi:hypothetical protein